MAERILETRGDQAEGLRRMLGRSAATIVTLASACSGVGKTSVAIQLGAALAASGVRVLLVDENHGSENVMSLLGLSPRNSLERVLSGDCRIEEAVSSTAHGFSVLSMAGDSRALPALRDSVRGHLASGLKSLASSFEVVLADAMCNCTSGMAELYGASQDTIVVSSTESKSVTASYALIKRLHGGKSRNRFHILLNRVEREDNGRVILNNLAGVSRRHLQMPVESLGCLPKDDCLRISQTGFFPVVAAFPASPSAMRYRGIAEAIASWPGARAGAGLIDRFMQHMLAGSSPAFASAGV